jgi:DNA-binding MarR family transcriptional regulator
MESLVDFLVRCHNVQKRIAGTIDLSIDEFHCLLLLHIHTPPSVKDLSRLLDVRSSRTSKLLSTLEERGYLSRTLSLSDRRVEEVLLTPRGVHAAETLLALLKEQSAPLLTLAELR